jgi:DNA-binding transcriptional ArsR family regulator
MAHPIRLRIMSLLTGAPMTAAEVARELGLTHANASYHLRNLLAAGLIVPDGEERIRGGVAKRYRYHTDREKGVKPSHGEMRSLYTVMANELIRRTADGDFDAKKHLTDAELWVDREVWEELENRIVEVSEDLHKAARPPRTPGTIRTSTTIAMFQMGEGR